MIGKVISLLKRSGIKRAGINTSFSFCKIYMVYNEELLKLKGGYNYVQDENVRALNERYGNL